MQPTSDEYYRIQKLPPYVFAVINEMRAKARAAGIDVIDLGMGNPKLREEIVRRYRDNYGVELDAEREAIVTIGAKDALAHLLFAALGPGDVVVSPNQIGRAHV